MSDLTPLSEALAAAIEQAIEKRARANVGPRSGIDLSAPPALLTVAQALDVMGVRDTAGKAYLEAHGLIGWWAGQRRVSLARLMASGYPEALAANDDAETSDPGPPDGIQFAKDML